MTPHLLPQRLIVLVVSLLLAAAATAQSPASSVTGRVLDAAKQPLPFATAVLLQLPDSAVANAQPTDESGNYTFQAVPLGRYCVKVTMVSYRPARSAAFAVAIAPVRVPTLTLAEQSTLLRGVTVQGRAPVLDQQADRLVLNVEKLNTAGDNALDVLAKLPGVRIDQNENVVLRGSRGLNVMVDGKMTYLAGTALSNYLKALPASALRRVELISNPPASFDAAGTAGIINLELKRSQLPGLQGTANAGLGYGRYEKAWGGTNLNYNLRRLRLFARLDVSHDQTFNRLDITRRINDTIYRQQNFWNPVARRASYAVGSDFAFAARHTVGVQLRGSDEPQRARVSSATFITAADGSDAGRVTMRSPQTTDEINQGLNLSYRWQIDTTGREFSVDADYVRFADDRTQDFTNRYFAPRSEAAEFIERIRSFQAADVTIRAAKADYRQPLSGGRARLETGWKSSWVSSRSAVRFDELRTDFWELDPSRTNDFRYDEDIHAAYISLGGTLARLEAKAGLRGEYTRSLAFAPTTGQRVQRDYAQLFPSLFLNYQLTEHNQLGASLSRRITRPNYQRLNPFIYYTDPYTVVEGNPFLSPALSNSVQAHYMHKNFQVLKISYLRERDAVHDVVFQNDETKLTTNSPRNLGRTHNLRLSSGGHFEPTKWWATDNQISGFYNRVRTGLPEANADLSQFSWGFSTDHSFTLPKELTLQLSAVYESPQVVGIMRAESYSSVNVGLKKQLWQQRATLSLRVTDIFYDNITRTVIRYNNVDTNWNYRFESRRASLVFSYRFGNKDVKAARTRDAVDEESRLRR